MIDEAAITAAIAAPDAPLLSGAAFSLTTLGSVTLTAVFVLVLYGGGERTTSFRLALASVVGGGTTLALKYLLMRPRPEIGSLTPLTPSFPSGHATLAFGTAVVLADRFDSMRPLFFGLAATVALTRVVLGVHYPSDVIVGAIIGTAGGLVAVRYGDRIIE
jgi:undecaprenyl-diphosphatase